MNVDTPFRALSIAAIVALACSIMVSSAVHFLRPLAPVEAVPARTLAVLKAAGMLPDDGAQAAATYRTLDARIVDLGSGKFVTGGDDPWEFDPWASGTETRTTDLERAPVYLVRNDGRLDRVVFPVHGPGMWSTIYAFVALQPDLETVAELVIFQHGETPGIGDRIEDESWLSRWPGRKVFGDDGEPRIAVVVGASGPYEVDAITGATVTMKATGDFIRESFGSDGYGPFIARFRAEAID